MGALLLGLIAMVIWNVVAPAFFRGETLSKRVDSDLILVALDHEDQTLRLPDSGPAGDHHRARPVEPAPGHERHGPGDRTVDRRHR